MLVHHLLSFGEPDRLAVFDQGRSYTYRDLRTLVRQCRNALYAQGIRQQTRVAIFSRKTVHYMVAYLALAFLGAIAVPINSQLSQREVGFIIRDSEAIFLLYTGNPFAWNALEATAATLVDGWLHTGDVVVEDEEGYLRIVDRLKDIDHQHGGKHLSPGRRIWPSTKSPGSSASWKPCPTWQRENREEGTEIKKGSVKKFHTPLVAGQESRVASLDV